MHCYLVAFIAQPIQHCRHSPCHIACTHSGIISICWSWKKPLKHAQNGAGIFLLFHSFARNNGGHYGMVANAWIRVARLCNSIAEMTTISMALVMENPTSVRCELVRKNECGGSICSSKTINGCHAIDMGSGCVDGEEQRWIEINMEISVFPSTICTHSLLIPRSRFAMLLRANLDLFLFYCCKTTTFLGTIFVCLSVGSRNPLISVWLSLVVAQSSRCGHYFTIQRTVYNTSWVIALEHSTGNISRIPSTNPFRLVWFPCSPRRLAAMGRRAIRICPYWRINRGPLHWYTHTE